MAQTPARDIINAAVVDFRFCNGDARNHANNANVLAGSGFVPIIEPCNGVPALVRATADADQTWMLADQDAVTIELLITPDMLHQGTLTTQPAAGSSILSGDWNLGVIHDPDSSGSYADTAKSGLWLSFNGATLSDTYFLVLHFEPTEVAESRFKGSPLHVIIAAQYVFETSMTVVATVNGVTMTDTSSDYSDNYITAAPTNSLFKPTSPVAACPVHLLRMWDTFIDDALVHADLYREAQRILPGANFPAIVGGSLSFYSPS